MLGCFWLYSMLRPLMEDKRLGPKNENGESVSRRTRPLRYLSLMPWQRPRSVAGGAHRNSGVIIRLTSACAVESSLHPSAYLLHTPLRVKVQAPQRYSFPSPPFPSPLTPFPSQLVPIKLYSVSASCYGSTWRSLNPLCPSRSERRLCAVQSLRFLASEASAFCEHAATAIKAQNRASWPGESRRLSEMRESALPCSAPAGQSCGWAREDVPGRDREWAASGRYATLRRGFLWTMHRHHLRLRSLWKKCLPFGDVAPSPQDTSLREL